MDDTNKHSLMQTEKSPHVCDTCGRRFGTKSLLKHHYVVHGKINPHVCHTCGRRFSRKDSMQRHRMIHIKEKSYSCSTCGSIFKRKSTLNLHNKKPCNKSHKVTGIFAEVFSRNDHLESYCRIQRDKKPHICGTCGKQFEFISSLTNHSMVHTEEKSYFCNTCRTTFKYKKTLNQHVKKTCNKSHKITGLSAEVLNINSEYISVSNNPSVCESARETDEKKNGTQPPYSDFVTLSQDALNFKQKLQCSVAGKAKESSILQNFGTYHGDLNAPKLSDQFSSEDTHNMELHSMCSYQSSELHGPVSKIDDSIACNNLTFPVARELSRENTLHPSQLEVSSWRVHEQASTSINGASAASSTEFGKTDDFLPDKHSAAFVHGDYSQRNPFPCPNIFFGLWCCSRCNSVFSNEKTYLTHCHQLNHYEF